MRSARDSLIPSKAPTTRNLAKPKLLAFFAMCHIHRGRMHKRVRRECHEKGSGNNCRVSVCTPLLLTAVVPVAISELNPIQEDKQLYQTRH
jgi:hypothetical protein